MPDPITSPLFDSEEVGQEVKGAALEDGQLTGRGGQDPIGRDSQLRREHPRTGMVVVLRDQIEHVAADRGLRMVEGEV